MKRLFVMPAFPSIRFGLFTSTLLIFGSTSDLVKKASITSVREAARRMQQEEAEHVRLIEQWVQRTPLPQSDWAQDPDRPVLSD